MLVCEIDIVSRDIDITKVSICTINGRVNCSSHTRLLLLSRLSNTQKLNKYTKIVISYLYILLTYKIHHRLLLHQLVRYCSLRKHLEEQKLFLSTKNTSYKKDKSRRTCCSKPFTCFKPSSHKMKRQIQVTLLKLVLEI